MKNYKIGVLGLNNTGYEDTMGTHGLGQMNENGERFAGFCALNQLVIGGSIFPHKRIHKGHMEIAGPNRPHLHQPEVQEIVARCARDEGFQPLQDLIEGGEMDIETQWEHSKKLWHDTCKEVLCKKKTQHKEWISADTIQKLEARKEKKTVLNTSRTRRAKAKAQEEYTAADREVKRSIRKDKRDYIDNLASQAEEAARQGNLKDLYQVTKKLAGKFQQTDKPVKNKNGHPLTTTEEQLKRWAEHFRELLNRPIPETPPDIPPAETELPVNCDKPSKAEI
nr:hypothetical protein BaRGS_005337 [Batillaria attramentaria]